MKAKIHVLIVIFLVSLLLVAGGIYVNKVGFAEEAAPDALAATQLDTMPPPFLISQPDPNDALERDDGGIDLLTFDDLIPDTTGAPGLTLYLQAVNEYIAAFDKGALNRLAEADFETFWANAPTGTACDGGQDFHHGQPQIIFDHLSQVWVVLDVAYEDIDDGPYYYCIAVSKSENLDVDSVNIGVPEFTMDDGTGSGIGEWYGYAIDVNAGNPAPYFYPDAPKLALWEDGYYIGVDLFDIENNGLTRTPKGVKAWALERAPMAFPPNYPNQSFQIQTHYLNESYGYQRLVPSNLSGDPPVPDMPNFFAAIAPPNNFYIWYFDVDWTPPPGSSTFGVGLTNAPNFTLNMQEGFNWLIGNIVPQPGTTEKLDVLGDRLMTPLQFREVNGVDTLWANHTVISGTVTGPHWLEIRDPGSDPYIYQEGIYTNQPDPACGTCNKVNDHYRWLSSMAVDQKGNMAIGYSESSDDALSAPFLYPSIRYTGRLASDPVGELIPNEAVLWDADPLFPNFYDNLNNINDGPWGRQSHMAVDPVDGCVFWYTNMYMNYELEQNNVDWHTRIGAFGFQECLGGGTSRISLHTNGTEGNLSSGMEAESYNVAVSADGRYVAFASDATNLVANDTNGDRDIFVRDRDTDMDGVYDEPGAVRTVRVSVGPNGVEANDDSFHVSISDDGRYVAFASWADNLLTTPDNNGAADVFVHDRDADGDGIFDETGPGERNTVRVSIRSNGSEVNGPSDQPSMSADGRHVAFRSSATNLVGGDTNFADDIFVHDRDYDDDGIFDETGTGNRTTVRVSVDVLGTQGNGPSETPTISEDGQFVAFASLATNLDAAFGATNGFKQIFRHDRDTDLNGVFDEVAGFDTILISRSDGLGLQGDADSYTPSISNDGQIIAFASESTDFVLDIRALLDNGYADIFVRDLTQVIPETHLISKQFLGIPALNGDSYTPAISGDGQFIAFASDAPNLTVLGGDTNGARDIFLYDKGTNATYAVGDVRRISVSTLGDQANGASYSPGISDDGEHVAYTSFADNLVQNDNNNVYDVFAFNSNVMIQNFLTIPANVPGDPGDTVDMDVIFTGNSQNIDSVAFSVDFDHVCLGFDDTDADNDGVPDSITSSLPSNFTFTVLYDPNDKDGELDFSVYDPLPPQTPLPDGTLLTIQFNVLGTCQAAPGATRSARVGFSGDPSPSYAANGLSLPGSSQDGSVKILEGLPGDCNGDQAVDAGDLTALVLEIFDGDGIAPTNTPMPTFPGNPVGCNSNRDSKVDAGDISCTVLIALNPSGPLPSCAGGSSTSPLLQAAGSSELASSMPEARLEIPKGIRVGPGDTVSLPVSLTTFGNNINSLIFSVDYDETILSFDGVNAVTLNIPTGFSSNVFYDPAKTDSEIGIAIFSISNPNIVLPDGLVATLSFNVKDDAAGPANSEIVFSQDPPVSFGNQAGQSLEGEALNGSVFLAGKFEIYLPSIVR